MKRILSVLVVATMSLTSVAQTDQPQQMQPQEEHASEYISIGRNIIFSSILMLLSVWEQPVLA